MNDQQIGRSIPQQNTAELNLQAMGYLGEEIQQSLAADTGQPISNPSMPERIASTKLVALEPARRIRAGSQRSSFWALLISLLILVAIAMIGIGVFTLSLPH